MKRGILSIALLITTLFLIFAILPLVSAQYSMWSYIDLGEGIRNIIDQVINFVTPVFEIILGDYSGSEYFFAKVLLVILLTIIIHSILERMPLFEGYKGTTTIIAIVVSVLGIRFLQDDLIQTILLPYNVLFIAIASFLPFLIVAYGIYFSNMSGIGRKFSWMIFLVIFVVIWGYRINDLGGIGSPGNQIYLWTSVVIVLMAIFDRRVHAYFRGLEGKKIEESVIDERIARLQSDIQYFTSQGPPSQAVKSTIQRKEREIRMLEARKRHLH